MRIQICMHWNFFDRTKHYKDIEPLSHTLMKRRHFNEKGEEPQSLSIDLAKKILRDQTALRTNVKSYFNKKISYHQNYINIFFQPTAPFQG